MSRDTAADLRSLIDHARGTTGEPESIDGFHNWTKRDVDARQKKSKHGAFNLGRRWEEHELETLRRTDLNLAEKALALGRTYDSVSTKCSEMRLEEAA